ncbi:hypothetical protein NESM_000377900 [Novymonas esmeraldas]|uniref:Uncharacterized protein n=1 Tax=Novymonas esmeraldas TaxID=1808958 RepID=A0AAW0ELR3_9TRYP
MNTRDDGAEPQWTIAVCTPACHAAHAVIVRELRDDGVEIVDRRFTLTSDQALVLVQQYAHLRRRASEHNRSSALAAEAAEASTHMFLSATRSEGRQRRWVDAPSQPHLRRRHEHAPPPPEHTRSQGESGQLLANIMRLAQGHRAPPPSGAAPAEGAVGSARGAAPWPPSRLAGAYAARGTGGGDGGGGVGGGGDSPSVGVSSEPTWSGRRTLHAVGSTTGHTTVGVTAAGSAAPPLYQRARPGAPLPPSVTANITPTANGFCIAGDDDLMAIADPQVRQHVEFLVHGGTTLVLLLRAGNAVDRLLRLAGPEDPREARRIAPSSWSARYGVDEAQMAVYTPATVADARAAVHAVFGDDLPNRTAHTSRARPPSEERAVTAAPLSFPFILPLLRAGVPATQRMSYYTGVPAAVTAAAAAATASVTVVAPLADELDGQTLSQRGGALDADGHMLSAATADPDSAMYWSTGPQYPQRQVRLDELDNLLRSRAVN